MLSKLHADPTSRLSLLPSDMFCYYFQPGYVPRSVLENGNKVSHCFRIPGMIRLTSLSIAVNDSHVVILYVDLVALFDRHSYQLLWKQPLVGGYDVVSFKEDGTLMIAGATRTKAFVNLDVTGVNINPGGHLGYSVATYHYNKTGDYVTIRRFEGVWCLLIVPMKGCSYSIALPDQGPLTANYESLLQFDAAFPACPLIHNNDYNDVCLISNGRIYVYHHTAVASPENPRRWTQWPHVITGPVKRMIIDNDRNVLLLQEKSMSIFSANCHLVRTDKRQFSNATVYQGVIYGCGHNSDAKVIE